MPGKYSHSVVLADYSSRGIISLPNEQHIAYLKSSPYASSTYSRKIHRVPSQRSNQLSTKTCKPSSQLDHHVRPSTALPSGGRYFIIDPATVRGQHDPMPSIQRSMQKLRSSSVEPTPGSKRAYGRVESEITKSNYGSEMSTGLPSTERPNEVRANVAESSQFLDLASSRSTKHPATSFHGESPSTVRGGLTDRASGQNQPSISRVTVPTMVAPQLSSDSMHGGVRQEAEVHHETSRGTVSTPMHRPLSPTVELDFEGFSDSEETKTPYFEPPPIPRGTGAPDAGAGMLSSLRKIETPPPRLVSQSQQSHTRTLQSALSVPSDRLLAASPDDYQGKHNSLTSQSSLGSWGTPSTLRGGKKFESSKVTILAQHSVERLPEIIEDSQFGPDLFTQGLNDVVPDSDLAMEKFGERSLGMISSGRDVSFDIESDNQSLASTACPPDIGRFREEDTPDAIQYLQSVKPHGGRSPSTHGSPSQPKKNKSLFSRFRSKP